jgi:predicted ATPase
MAELKKITIDGFKSFRHVEIELGRINVLIGANGSGKSNLLSFFDLLLAMINSHLKWYVLRNGLGHTFLHYGPRKTQELCARIEFSSTAGDIAYSFRLGWGRHEDSLVLLEEAVEQRQGPDTQFQKVIINDGSTESRLAEAAREGGYPVTGDLWHNLNNCGVFQLFDTSAVARIRQGHASEDSSSLHRDAGNLAVILLAIQSGHAQRYHRIIETIRMVAPFFDDFQLIHPEILDTPPPNPMFMLNWKEQGQDVIFGPHQLPDGLLRFIALTSTLLQPEKRMPGVMIIDEPELGLHPLALNILGALIRETSHRCQIIIATQSARLVDEFEPEHLLVAQRQLDPVSREHPTEFKRLDPETLKVWMDDYSLGELWEKNIFGGRP